MVVLVGDNAFFFDELVNSLSNIRMRWSGYCHEILEEFVNDIEDPELLKAIIILTDWAAHTWKWGPPMKNRGKWIEGLKMMRGKAQPCCFLSSEIFNSAIELYIERLQFSNIQNIDEGARSHEWY